MDNPFHSKLTRPQVISILAVIIVLVGGGIYWAQKEKSQNLSTTPSVSQKPFPYTTLPLNEIPDAFPPGIPVPVEPPNLLLLSYSQIVGNKEQTTIQFISSKSAAKTLELYKKYLKDKGWIIAAELDQNALKSLSAKKEIVFLSITISSKNPTEEVLVDLTIITPQKTKISPTDQNNTTK